MRLPAGVAAPDAQGATVLGIPKTHRPVSPDSGDELAIGIQQAHSKCSPVALKPGAHSIKLALSLRGKEEGDWKGRIDSNEAKFALEK